ncbi:MAG TPA: hypothetical protein PK760_10120 [Flavobacteriales bacterium]|nr:hypothetical protein [Flavobacteriales bacterium]
MEQKLQSRSARVLVICSILACSFTHPLSAQDRPPKTTPILFHGSLDLSAVLVELPELRHFGRSSLVMTHYRSGWGIAYAGQDLRWRGEGATYRGTGFFGNYEISPKNEMTLRNLMVIKEFHLASTELFRPCLEAGISFIEFHQDQLVTTVYSPDYTDHRYVSHLSHELGFDTRIRAFLPISRAFAFEVALHANFNPVQSYASFEFGFALGMVRPPRPKKPK